MNAGASNNALKLTKRDILLVGALRAPSSQCALRSLAQCWADLGRSSMVQLSRLQTGMVLVLIVAVGTTVLAAGNESHRGLRYLAWRYCRFGDWRYGIRFLNVDPGLRASLVGTSRADLTKRFPDLRPGSSRPFVCGASPQYEEMRRDQASGDWIGETPWLVVYDRAGHVRDITLPKGC
jgi:hypothetical protein